MFKAKNKFKILVCNLKTFQDVFVMQPVELNCR